MQIIDAFSVRFSFVRCVFVVGSVGSTVDTSSGPGPTSTKAYSFFLRGSTTTGRQRSWDDFIGRSDGSGSDMWRIVVFGGDD